MPKRLAMLHAREDSIRQQHMPLLITMMPQTVIGFLSFRGLLKSIAGIVTLKTHFVNRFVGFL